ncbi:MAG: hypothetical protein OEY09_08495 [Gammaproteobacteria bacterium]|nr:hypothetical protein [Gammaproteobacteria bacterium]
MDPSIVLHKTDKGITELKTREYSLPRALRTALILVDGKANVGGLCKKVPAFTEMVDSLGVLLKDGFISAGGDETADTSSDGNSVTQAKWDIVEMIIDVLGEEVGHRATKRFTAVPDTVPAMKQALNECSQFIALTIDEKKAKTIESRGLEILSKI